MTGKDFRTASEIELARDLARIRRARQAMENHKRPPRTPGAKVRDALNHAQKHIKKPGTVMSGYRVSENSRNADDEQNNTPSSG